MSPDSGPDSGNVGKDDSTGLAATSGETRRLLILALIVLAAVLALHVSPLKAWLDELRALKLHIGSFGWKVHVFFVLGSIAAIAAGIPRLALCGLAGLLFGFLEGMLVAMASGLLGSYGTFLLARWGGRAWGERKLAGASERLRTVLAKPDIASIFIARQLPVPGIVANVLLGILPTPHRTFLIGSFLGYLPSNTVVALAGSSLGKDSLEKAIAQVTLSMAGLGAFSLLLLWVRQRYRVRD